MAKKTPNTNSPSTKLMATQKLLSPLTKRPAAMAAGSRQSRTTHLNALVPEGWCLSPVFAVSFGAAGLHKAIANYPGGEQSAHL